jgi:hypothetical protein
MHNSKGLPQDETSCVSHQITFITLCSGSKNSTMKSNEDANLLWIMFGGVTKRAVKDSYVYIFCQIENLFLRL